MRVEVLAEYLVSLAAEVRQWVGAEGVVRTRGSGLDLELQVEPRRSGPCHFEIYLQGEDELTVRLGVFTTVDVFSRSLDNVKAGCRDLVRKLVAGEVSETVWIRDGSPCRAVAHIGAGRNVVKWTTSRGLCRRSVRQRERHYEPYVRSDE